MSKINTALIKFLPFYGTSRVRENFENNIAAISRQADELIDHYDRMHPNKRPAATVKTLVDFKTALILAFDSERKKSKAEIRLMWDALKDAGNFLEQASVSAGISTTNLSHIVDLYD